MDVLVKRLRSKENACYVSSDIFDQLDLIDEQDCTLAVGHFNVNITVKKTDEHTAAIYLPAYLFERLLLINGIRLNVWKAGRTIYLGPVVGIFVNPRFISSLARGKIPLPAVKNVQANKAAKCFIYYFSIDQIRWKDQSIQGYAQAPDSRKWICRSFPFPNIIYDCGVKFDRELKPEVKLIRKLFAEHPAVRLINNSDYLGKWELYDRLSQHAELREYLPETMRCTSFEDIKDMLERHRLIYIKSFYGSRGREVMSVEQSKKGLIVNHYHHGLKRAIVKNDSELENRIYRFLGDKPLIVQKGIDLLTFKGRKLDLRVLICKNGSGQWKVIYNQANVAKRGATITTIGKNYRKYKEIYRYWKRRNGAENIPRGREIRRKTVMIARYIEQEFGLLGELGMDMAVDKEGKLWFIEANSKPEKLPIRGLEDTKSVSPQYLSVFQYATYLAKEASGAL